MIVSLKHSSLSESVRNSVWNWTKVIQSNVIRNIKQNNNNRLESKTLGQESDKPNSTVSWERIEDNEAMAASVVYNDYETTTSATSKQDISTLPAQTVATFIINSKRPTIIVYPTVSPESIVIPIVSCILGFPLLALLVICCLRRRAKLARERDRRRNYDMQDHAVSLVRFSPIHRLNNRSSRAISLRPERSLSRGFPSLELDTVVEERSDVEQTQTEIFNSDSPLESTSQHNSCSS